MLDFIVKPVGDCAASVEFKNEISVAVSRQLHALDKELRALKIEGVIETIPAYRTLTVPYRPEVISYDELVKRITPLRDIEADAGDALKEILEIPVLYGGEAPVDGEQHYDGWDGRETAPDMEDVLRHEQISKEEFIRRHTASLHYIYCQAFALGHSYLGTDVKSFTVSRRGSPRVKVPKGSIGIWSDQTVLNGVALPCGWQVVGRTPVNLYDETREEPSLCRSGEWIRFRSIDADEYRHIASLEAAGEYRPVFKREAL